MTAWFNNLIQARVVEHARLGHIPTEKRRDAIIDVDNDLVTKMAYFDARAFNVPKEEVANYFVWRAKDWERNSLSMYCMQCFSHKELQGKSATDRHEMLHQVGKNWAKDVEPAFRNGSFILKDGTVRTDVVASYTAISALVNPLVYKETAQV